MSQRTYRFWIESPGELLNENFTDLLNRAGHSADTLAERLDVDDIGEVYAYEVPGHALITFVRKSEHRAKFRVFVQEGRGKIRLYHNFHKILDTNERLRSQQALAETIKRASQIRNDDKKHNKS